MAEPSHNLPAAPELLNTLSERCLALGIKLFIADAEGNAVWDCLTGKPLGQSPSGNQVDGIDLHHYASRLTEAGTSNQEPIDLGSDQWIIPLFLLERRRVRGILLAVMNIPSVVPITTSDSTGNTSPDIQKLDESVSLQNARTWVSILNHWYDDLSAAHSNQREMAVVSQHLSDTYEEINLLNKIGQRMNVVRHPHRFLQMVCRELIEVVPYSWIGVRLIPNSPLAKQFGDLFVCEGLPSEGFTSASEGTAECLRRIGQIDETIIANDVSCNEQLAPLRNITTSLLLHPLKKDSKMYGAIFACDKCGEDPQITTFDQKLFDTTASNVRIFLDNASLYEEMQRMFLGTLEALTASIDAKDAYTCGHSTRVAYLSRTLGRAVGLDEDAVEKVHIAGLVHDVGKIGVPESVLCKPGRLTDEEFSIIRLHPTIGARILRDIPHFEDVIPGVLHHHERFDGSGYPDRLKGEAIPLFGRIIAVADSFDAMSSSRTYRAALPRTQVLDEILRCSGAQFDPDLTAKFIELNLDEYDAMFFASTNRFLHRQGEAA
jgi:HD-GYP domain-containing protein (c-di-GMP phosphodiesterase class II)